MTGSGGTPVSGGFVDLKGTMVPTEKAIAFIHFGHSNMAGRGRAPTSLRPYNFTDVDPRAWMHHTAGQRTGFNPALEPYTAGDSASISSMTGGPGTPLVKEAVKLAGPGYHFISLGFASNGSYCRQFAAANYFNAIMASPRALKGKVTFGAIVVMLGITERHGTDQDIANYAECINGIVTRIRTELGLTPKQLPLLITDYEMTADNSRGEDLRPTGPFGRLMVPSIRRVPSVVAESALVETEGLAIVDDHHYQLDAHQIWVQRALAHMKEKGWWHWGP